MANINQWEFEELPNSKLIITEEVLNRLIFLIGRTTWIASEHCCTLFGRKLQGEETWIIDEVNTNEDYISRGSNSTNPKDYSVSTGKKQAEEIVSKLENQTGLVVIDVHTHPSGLIEDYRFQSLGDLEMYIQYNEIVSKKRGTFFGGLIGVDRVNGNMSFSIIWYDKTKGTFKIIKDIFLKKTNENGKTEIVKFPKYGNTQLIYQKWGMADTKLSDNIVQELTNLKRK